MTVQGAGGNMGGSLRGHEACGWGGWGATLGTPVMWGFFWKNLERRPSGGIKACVSSPEEVHFPTEFERVIPNCYHGTDLRSAENALKVGFIKGRGPSLFLGDGVYFYESCCACAWRWTAVRNKIPPAVLRCSVSLGKCIDFTNSYFTEKVSMFYEELRAKLASQLLTRHVAAQLTQTAVVNLIAGRWGADSVRCEFHRNRPLVPGGNILVDSHIVICVRNTEKISDPILETRPPTAA